MPNNHDTVMRFIGRFTNNGKRQEVIDCFSNGCCYWFASILYDRFFLDVDDCFYMYDPVANHWGCQIGSKIYDISGDVTDDYDWVLWNNFMYEDTSLTKRLYRDCINFGGPEDDLV